MGGSEVSWIFQNITSQAAWQSFAHATTSWFFVVWFPSAIVCYCRWFCQSCFFWFIQFAQTTVAISPNFYLSKIRKILWPVKFGGLWLLFPSFLTPWFSGKNSPSNPRAWPFWRQYQRMQSLLHTTLAKPCDSWEARHLMTVWLVSKVVEESWEGRMVHGSMGRWCLIGLLRIFQICSNGSLDDLSQGHIMKLSSVI